MKTMLVLAGVGQLGLALGSLAVPCVLRWKEDTVKLRSLTRQVFWTYAAYVWATNVTLGLLSTFGPGLLLDRSPLARVVCGYITAYWAARLLVQFLYFDRSEAPSGAFFKVAEASLVTLFTFLTAVYGYLAVS
jgi:hypothetical protein